MGRAVRKRNEEGRVRSAAAGAGAAPQGCGIPFTTSGAVSACLRGPVFAAIAGMPQTLDLEQFVGRPTDRFSLDEREALVGKYIARAVYTPQTLPLQRIEAIGDSVADCVAMLRRRNLDPLDFEFVQMKPAY